MRITTTHVVLRRQLLVANTKTFPFEVGWANELLVFVQAEGEHAALQCLPELSPDGLNWIVLDEPFTVAEDAPIGACRISCFGNWIRIAICGWEEGTDCRVSVHLVAKG